VLSEQPTEAKGRKAEERQTAGWFGFGFGFGFGFLAGSGQAVMSLNGGLAAIRPLIGH
jgi:hypothetical protein